MYRITNLDTTESTLHHNLNQACFQWRAWGYPNYSIGQTVNGVIDGLGQLDATLWYSIVYAERNGFAA